MNPAVMDFASTVQLCVSVGTLITLIVLPVIYCMVFHVGNDEI